MIWRENLDGHVWEILNPDFGVSARLWVVQHPHIDEAPYYLTFRPFADPFPTGTVRTPIIADDLEHAKDIAQAIYQLYDGDNICTAMRPLTQ